MWAVPAVLLIGEPAIPGAAGDQAEATAEVTTLATTTMTRDNHDQTVADGIVLIDFWASWCGPCLRFAPVFERVSDQNPDVVFAKVDTEAESELAASYGVSSIPTLVAYRDGIPLFAQPGALPEPALTDLLRRIRDLDMVEIRDNYERQRAGRS
jgi:thioredoxin 1